MEERKGFINKIFLILLLAVTAVFLTVPKVEAHKSKSELIHQKHQTHVKMAQTHAKIIHLKFLENLETNKLYKNQQKHRITAY